MFVDESRADSNTGIRMASWSPVGVMPVPYILYNRGKQRVNILPTYTIKGALVLSAYRGLTNTEGYNYWIEYFLLPCYNPYPVLKLEIVMDKASFYYLPLLLLSLREPG